MTILIFILLKFVNLRSYEAYNYSLSIIASGGFLPNNNFDLTFATDISKIILSVSMLLSFFSLFLLYNLVFFKKKNIGLKTRFGDTLFNENSMNINLLIFKRIEFIQRKLICIFEDL